MHVTRTIVVVTDDLVFATQLETVLSDAGYLVLTITCGKSAHHLLTQIRPQLVVLDGQVASVAAGDLIGNLQTQRSYRNTPVLLLSDHGLPYQGDYPYTALIPKPCTVETVYSTIEQVFVAWACEKAQHASAMEKAIKALGGQRTTQQRCPLS